jgi:hypothetical protein
MYIGVMKNTKTPARTVTFRDMTYKVRGKVEIPDLAGMGRFEALMWLNRHTYARGYSRPNPLAGLAGVVSVEGK